MKAYYFPYVEPLSDPRTKTGERRVLARRGWVGANSAFFNSLSGVEPTAGGFGCTSDNRLPNRLWS